MKVRSYRQGKVEEVFDAIVIGSGVGGMTTAALLARHAAQRVLVLERHYAPGGFTQVFHRPGYEWDVGLHYIGQVSDPAFPVRAAFDHLTDGRLQWQPMPKVYDRLMLGDRRYEFLSGPDRFRVRLKEYFPSEGPAIDGYRHGEIYGLAQVPERFRLDCLGPRTPVPGLYPTGADVATLGVTGDMVGGVLAASVILRRNLMAKVTKGNMHPTPQRPSTRAAA